MEEAELKLNLVMNAFMEKIKWDDQYEKSVFGPDSRIIKKNSNFSPIFVRGRAIFTLSDVPFQAGDGE